MASKVEAVVLKEMSMQRQFSKKTSVLILLIVIRSLPTIKKRIGAKLI